MNILVTGATSFIGLEVISQLLKKGHEVRTLTRQENTPAILKNTEIWKHDLFDLPAEIVKGVDVVIHIAAATPNTNPDSETYRKINVDCTRHLLSLCEENHVSHFIYISSTVVLFDSKDAYTQSKKEAESIISKSKLNWTILRPSEIIGADKSLEKFFLLLSKKKFVFIPGSGKQTRHPVYYLDVANAIVQVVANENTIRKKYILAAFEPVSYHNYLSIVKRLFKFNYTIMIIPLWILKIMAGMKKILPSSVNRKTGNAFNMMRSFSYDIQNGITDFGYAPIDVETGFSKIAKE